MKNINYVKYLQKPKNSKNVPLNFLSFHFSSCQSTMTSCSGGQQTTKKPQAQKQKPAPKSGYVHFIYLYIL